MTAAEKTEQKAFVREVLEKTGLPLERVAQLLGRKLATVEKMKWGDVRLTEVNRAQLQTILQNYTKGRPSLGVTATPSGSRLPFSDHALGDKSRGAPDVIREEPGEYGGGGGSSHPALHLSNETLAATVREILMRSPLSADERLEIVLPYVIELTRRLCAD
jgi:hypothetical protein